MDFGSENSKQWTQSLYGKKYSFQNPLHQNYRHTKAVAEFLKVDHKNVHSVIFFIGDNVELKTELPSNVMTRGISRHIKGFKKHVFTEEEIKTFTAELGKLKEGNISGREHVAGLKKRYSSTTTCPKCGKPLVKRTAKSGPHVGKEFLGCSGFPVCKFTKKIPPQTIMPL